MDNGNNNSFCLPSSLTVEHIEEVALQLRESAGGATSAFTLDAFKVERITTPGLQLIIALDKTLARAGGCLKLEGAREEVRQVFIRTGLETLFNRLQGHNA